MVARLDTKLVNEGKTERTGLRYRYLREMESRTMEEEASMGRTKGGEGEKEKEAADRSERRGGCEFGGSRFPRDVGRKVPAGPVLSPRQDDQPAVSNIKPTCTGSLSSTRYPNLPSDQIPPRTPRPRVTTSSPPLPAIKTYA